MATLMPEGRQSFTDSAGAPLVGGKLYTYLAGTSTPKQTFSDAAGLTPNTNPVILNARGEATVFWSGAYKITLTDAADVTIWTVDNAVSVDSIASSATSQLIADLADANTLGKGDALIGWGAITATVSGIRIRYASLAAAVAGVGSNKADIEISRDTIVSSDVTVPNTCALRLKNNAAITIDTTFTLTINGPFEGHGGRCFSQSGTGKVVFGPSFPRLLFPQWWGALGDAVVSGASGTDSTAAFLAMIAASTDTGLVSGVSIFPTYVGSGNWLVGQLRWPSAFRMVGAGTAITNLVCKPGTTGVWLDDNGSGAKIEISGICGYVHSEAGVTYGFRCGYNGVQHGVEGRFDNIWMRDVNGASAIAAIDINGNVGFYDHLAAYNAPIGIRITGVANSAGKLVAYGCTVRGVDTNLTDHESIEIEAPGNGCVPLYFTGSSRVSKPVTVSLANGTNISHLVELTANTTDYGFPLRLAFGNAPAWSAATAYVPGNDVISGGVNYRCILGNTNQVPPNATYWTLGIVVSNGNIKRADGSYCGGNATGNSRNGEYAYESRTDCQIEQSFILRVTNTAGTMQHRMATASGATSGYVNAINAASSTLQNTPTGADAATAMAFGGKIGGTTASIFWFDTWVQKDASLQIVPTIVTNSTGTGLNVIPVFQSININGISRTRFGIQLTNSTTGTGFSMNTVNFAAGTLVQVQCTGPLSH